MKRKSYYLEKDFEKPFGINKTWGHRGQQEQGSENRGNLVEVVPRRKMGSSEQREVVEGERGGRRAERAGTSCGEPAGGGPRSLQCGGEA